jgi:hypothetical protein
MKSTAHGVFNTSRYFINLARWCNRPKLLWSTNFAEYNREYRAVSATIN